MEADFVTNDMLIEEPFEADENVNNDILFIEGEKCGICMDIVIDRGVLDCCQHWFCFACIDNWASITNLCPLCQNEFQLITCVPVYDTIGSNKIEDDMLSRDDDWSIEGKNNTLSFPSYYIDENAVICLDGDGCKIRSGSAMIEDDLNLDTSIACDSCDIWYHAFCVGFDPEGTSEVSWLCPRCLPDKVTGSGPERSLEKTTMEINPENGDKDGWAEESFSGKVSVSVADDGETAVVVSLVEGNQWIPVSREKGLSPLEASKNLLTESCASIPDTSNLQSNMAKTINSPGKQQELELSLSHSVIHSLSSSTKGPGDLNKGTHVERSDPSSLSRTDVLNESHGRASTSRNGSDLGLHLGLSVGSFLCVDDTDMNSIRDEETDLQLSNSEEFNLKVDDTDMNSTRDEEINLQLSNSEFNLKGDEVEPNALKDNAIVMGQKRKPADCSNNEAHIEVDRDAEPKPEVEVLQKKLRTDDSLLKNQENVGDAPLLDNNKTRPSTAPISRHDDVKLHTTQENTASDIMSIVKGTKWKPPKGISGTKSSNNLYKNNENMAGLRVKKIMKRAPDHGESSLVQNLREEIREAVRNKSSKIFEETLDTKLLAAFRAAVAGPKTETSNKPPPMAMKAKKTMLQKGKVREHLTRKIFATSNGRRKRAWDRDCEIEFWKHRCMRATKPEKIETLKSVLDLLRNSSRSAESKEDPGGQAGNSILSRLYLADTSVFPRKDDVKPLSVLETDANSEQNKKPNLSGKALNQSLDNGPIKSKELNKIFPKSRDGSSENKVNKKIVQSSVGGNSTSGKAPSGKHSEGATGSCPGGSRVDSKESSVKSDCMKSDKRKWALEVLARKTAAAGKKMTNDSQGDNAILGANYPLLVQLPADMRPVLAPSRHNKIPISVRQTQLYRLTEHFLKNANLSVIRRTADTELAVADAINIEKEVADRSNSKLVYLNLCSQELLHRSNNRKSDGTATPQVSSAIPTDRSEQNIDDDLSTDSEVQMALKNAGLLSDSPPCSPSEKVEISNKEADLPQPDNILELDFQPEMDIYGDFEYDLGDEDYIGAGVFRGLNSQEEESESKLKLVFSTVNLKNSDTDMDCTDSGSLENNGVPLDPSCSSNHDNATNTDPGINAESDNPPSASSEALPSEPCDAECEELYGPEKEPLAKKFPNEEFITLHREGKSETSTEDNGCHTKVQASDQAVKASEPGNDKLAKNMPVTVIADNSSNASDISENVQRKGDKSATTAEQSDSANHVVRMVEAYVKEHIRPLCKSGVITAEQYRWAVAKTTEKVMKYHCKAKNASFLIKEGEKVKKLAEQYVETSQQNRKN